MNSPRVIHLGVVINERFATGAAVLIQSLAESLASKREVKIHALTHQLSDDIGDLLILTCQRCGVKTSISFYPVEETEHFKHLESLLNRLGVGHTRALHFIKLLFAELVDEPEILYIDTDIFVNRDLSELYDIPMGDCPVLAVQDVTALAESKKDGVSHFLVMDLPGDAPFFNSGVMKVNLDEWRSSQRFEKCMEIIVEYFRAKVEKKDVSKFFGDQVVLNILYFLQWKSIPGVWNRVCPVGRNAFIAFQAEPVLIHYILHPKAWELPYSPKTALFYDTLDRTPFSGWRCSLLSSQLRETGARIKIQLLKRFPKLNRILNKASIRFTQK